MSLLRKTVLSPMQSIAIALTATISFRAVAVEQLRAPILIPNIQEPEEMRVAPFPMRVSTPTDGELEEATQAARTKMRSGSSYEAIEDFTQAIKIEGRALLKSSAYEGRADAYMQMREWDLAVKDLNAAISFQIAGSVMGNVRQFREIYPEYAAVSDEAIAHKLNQTFYPNIQYEDFSAHFLRGHSWSSTGFPKLYIKRSDAYLRKGDWRVALIDFRRATNGFLDYAEAIDRWRQFDQTPGTASYIDMEDFDDVRDGLKLSIKQAHVGNDARGLYELYRFELDCGAEKIRTLSWAEYDASGIRTKSGEGGRWGKSGRTHLVRFSKMVPAAIANPGRSQMMLANLHCSAMKADVALARSREILDVALHHAVQQLSCEAFIVD